MNTNYVYHDGGTSEVGYKGVTGDCSVRAICIALKSPYKETYKKLANMNAAIGGKKSVRHGLPKELMSGYLKSQGWVWKSSPKFTGRKAKPKDMPSGVVIAQQSGHYVAVIDGVPFDIFDSSNKMVYGYWQTLNRVMINFDKSVNRLWQDEKQASIEAVDVSRNEALTFLASERERIMKMSKDEAIAEILKSSKLEGRIRAVKSVSDNGLFGMV